MEPAFHHWFPQNGAWAALKPPPNVLKNPHEPAFHPWVFPKRSLDSPKTTPNQKKKNPEKKKNPKTPQEKCLSRLTLVTYEMSVTVRGATEVILQRHEILPRKMALMIDLRYIWNAIYIAQSNRTQPPKSPNIACHEKWRCKISEKITENRWNVICNARPIRAWSGTDQSMIREWSEHEPSSPQPTTQPRLLFVLGASNLFGKLQHFRAPAMIPNFTKYCACHKSRQLNFSE